MDSHTTEAQHQGAKALVESYYHSLDTHAYDQLTSLLHPAFVHERPDMTLSSRDEFVTFMREKRPNTETSHPLDELYMTEPGTEIAARGRLLAADGELITRFVDIFSFENDQITRIETFTH